jgi:hypothetical protein
VCGRGGGGCGCVVACDVINLKSILDVYTSTRFVTCLAESSSLLYTRTLYSVCKRSDASVVGTTAGVEGSLHCIMAVHEHLPWYKVPRHPPAQKRTLHTEENKHNHVSPVILQHTICALIFEDIAPSPLTRPRPRVQGRTHLLFPYSPIIATKSDEQIRPTATTSCWQPHPADTPLLLLHDPEIRHRLTPHSFMYLIKHMTLQTGLAFLNARTRTTLEGTSSPGLHM